MVDLEVNSLEMATKTAKDAEPISSKSIPAHLQSLGSNGKMEVFEMAYHPNEEDEIIESRRNNKNLLFLCYVLGSICYGGFDAFPGAIFSQLIKQLDVDELRIGILFSLRSIGYISSCIVTGISLDKYENTHKLNAIILLCGGAASSFIPFTNVMCIQYILWLIIGFAFGHIETILPVYIYRAYRGNPDQKLNVILVIYGLTKTFVPLIIQISISIFDTYANGIFLISIFTFLFSVCSFYLNTPKHDKLRSIQKEIERTGSLRDAQDVISDLEGEKCETVIRNGFVCILSLVYFLFQSIQSGLIIFVTLFCTNYLNIDAKFGRYLISTYFSGQLLYRIVKILLISTSSNAKKSLEIQNIH